MTAVTNGEGRGRHDGGRGRGRQGGGGGRGGRGGGGGGGRGRGRGGSGPPGRGGRSGPGRGTSGDRKINRRQKQLESMDKKAKEEDDYFRHCQKEARKNNGKNFNPKDDISKAREDELFGKQIVKGINFEKYNEIKVEVKVPTDDASDQQPVSSMEDFAHLPHVNPQLEKNIQLMKYTHPTPIQKWAIPLAMAGKDLMCCAQTGSGKTCAFLLPIVAGLLGNHAQPTSNITSSVNSRPHRDNNGESHGEGQSSNQGSNSSSLEPAKPIAIILAPTRELAMQIELEAQKLTHAMPFLQPVVVYGGANAKAQLKELAYANYQDGNHLIVVATPGRLTDFVDRNLVSLSNVQYLVLDEADRCLDMGFEPQIRKIVQQSGMTPKEKRQTFMFSATFPPSIQKLAAEFLRPNYVWIAIGRVGSTTDSITQAIVKATADKRRKLQLVVEALQNGPTGRTLIFVQKKKTATWLKKQLVKGGPDAGPKAKYARGGDEGRNKLPQPFEGQEFRFTPISAEEIHGDRSQSQREAALEKFRAGKCTVLVATDVAARGLDIPGVEHVINMDLPTAEDDFDSYVHRIGRTGRAGHNGLATSLFVPGDNPKSENGRIARLLVNQLKESKQEVPEWLENLVAGGGGSNTKGKPQFTSSDVRKNTSRPATRANNTSSNDDSNNKSDGNEGDRGGRSGGRGRSHSRGRGRGREQGSAKGYDNQSEPVHLTKGPISMNGMESDNKGSSENGPGGRNGGGEKRGRGARAGRGGRGRGRNQDRVTDGQKPPTGEASEGNVSSINASGGRETGRGGQGAGRGRGRRQGGPTDGPETTTNNLEVEVRGTSENAAGGRGGRGGQRGRGRGRGRGRNQGRGRGNRSGRDSE